MSRIMLGLMRIADMEEKAIEDLIEQSLALGISMFDIADIYGRERCESLLGNVLRRRPDLRKRMYIQTKGGINYKARGYDSSYQYLRNALDNSLSRLGLDYLDSYLIHRVDIFMDNEEVKAFVDETLSNKKIKDFGVSNFTSSQIEYLLQAGIDIKYNQVHLSIGNTTMIDQNFYTNISSRFVSKESDDLYFYLKRKNIAIQCWSPFLVSFQDGSIFNEEKYPEMNNALKELANKYQVSKCAIATAFLLSLNKDLIVITGSTNIEHIKECLDGEKINLSKTEWYNLYERAGHLLP